MTDLRQLTRDLAHLREDVDYLTALLEPDLNRSVDANQPPIAAVAATAHRTDPTLPATAARSTAAHVWCALTPGEATRAWRTVTGWVDWLTDRYGLDDTIPDCWYRHGAITDELDALRAAWTAAYLDPTARPTDAAYWHELLDRTLTRVRGWDRSGCAAGTHRAGGEVPPDQTARTTRDGYVTADLQRRAQAIRPASLATEFGGTTGDPADAGDLPPITSEDPLGPSQPTTTK